MSKTRGELVEEYIESIFYIETEGINKGKVRLYDKGKSVLVDSVWGLYYKLRKDRGWLINNEEEFKSNFIVGVMEGLYKKEELVEVSEYLEGKDISDLEGNLKLFLMGYLNIDKDKGEEYRKIQGKNRVVKRLNDSLDYTYSDGGVYADTISDSIQDKGGYGEINTPVFREIINNREKVFTRLQNDKFNKLTKGNFGTTTSDFEEWGYKNQEDFVISKGLKSLDMYKSFILGARKRVEKVEKEYKEEGMLINQLKEFEGILDKDISDIECQFRLNVCISKYYENEEFELVITNNLSVGEKVEIVKCVKEFKGIISDSDSVDDSLINSYKNKLLDKRIIYKIIDNVLDKIEVLDNEEVEISTVEIYRDNRKSKELRNDDYVVYVTSHGAVIPSREVEDNWK